MADRRFVASLGDDREVMDILKQLLIFLNRYEDGCPSALLS